MRFTGCALLSGLRLSILLALQAAPPFRWELGQILQQSHSPKQAAYSSPPKQAAYSPGGNQLAIWYPVFENNAQNAYIIEFWDTRSGRMEGMITEQTSNGGLSMAWSPLSTHVVVVSGWPGTAIKIWDVRSRAVVRNLGGHLFRVNSLAWSPDATLIAKSAEGMIELWDATTGLQLRTIHSTARECHTLTWSADSKQIGAACTDIAFSRTTRLHDEFRIWDAASGRLAKSLAVPIRSGYGNYAVAWSPDLTHVASLNAAASTTLVYDMRVGRLSRSVPMKSEVRSLAWSSDSRYIAAGHQRAISIWDAEDGSFIAKLPGGPFACWSPDNRRIASTREDGSVGIWTRIDSPK